MEKRIKGKKGFELQNLYGFVLMLVLIGLIIGVGVLILDKFAATGGLTDTTISAINDARDAITPIASTWLTLIVTIVVLAIILTIVIRSFAVGGNR